MMTNLYIIRHGEAVCNVGNIVGGRNGCQGLTPRGHEQAARLQARLARGEIRADVLYASPLRRARETAQAAAAGLDVPIRWDEEFEEIRPGEADGMTYDEARERFNTAGRDIVYQPYSPGGESFAMFVARVGRALSRILRQHEGQNIVVVAHGGIIEASFYYFLGSSAALVLRSGFWIHHTSITQWRQGDPASDQRWYLLRYNDVAHLDSEMLASTEPL
ncbi:MAG TPA: histidine phosphatase family protein [Herpetosiphonaceae bacterium]